MPKTQRKLTHEQQQARKRDYDRRYKATHEAQVAIWRAQYNAAQKTPKAREAAQEASALAQKAHRQHQQSMIDFVILVLLDEIDRKTLQAQGTASGPEHYITADRRVTALHITKCCDAVEWLNSLRGKQ